jgi:hypothetical protein
MRMGPNTVFLAIMAGAMIGTREIGAGTIAAGMTAVTMAVTEVEPQGGITGAAGAGAVLMEAEAAGDMADNLAQTN